MSVALWKEKKERKKEINVNDHIDRHHWLTDYYNIFCSDKTSDNIGYILDEQLNMKHNNWCP